MPQASRRQWLQAGLAAGAATAWPDLISKPAQAADLSSKWMTIDSIERTTVMVPYREVPARSMARELPHWRYSEIFEVRLKSGKVGLGETLLFYTWGATTDEDVQRAQGQNALELMWDDSLGAGLQMALFDAVARSLDCPVHALLGQKKHQKTLLSWWNIDTSPEDMALECAEAYRLGYRSYKTKGRPWIDLWAQIEQSCKVIPPEFKIDMDFNDTLLDADRAIAILSQFDKIPQIDIWEGPIPQSDLAGNHKIREAVTPKVALHYGKPDPIKMIRADAVDGFVMGGGASFLIAGNAVSEMADLPFWLQLVGTGITAAFSLQFAGALSYARWPAVNCHQLYTKNMLTQPILLKDGYADVPDRPGLGFELDRDAVQAFKVAKPKERPEPERLIETTWPDGKKMYIANTGKTNFMLQRAINAEMPYFTKGVKTRLFPNDGTPRWRQLYTAAREKAVFE